jgi:four helix bundle protein
MTTIKRFEDLECWQEARKLVKMIYDAIKNSPEFQKDFKLVGQFTAAGISVMNNIVEGWASQSNPEFIRFLKYSRRSAAECQNCSYVALDQKYISQDTFQAIYDQALKTIKIIDGLLRYLRSQLPSKRPKRPKRSKPS